MSNAISNRRKANQPTWQKFNPDRSILSRTGKKVHRLNAIEEEISVLEKAITEAKKKTARRFAKIIIIAIILVVSVLVLFSCGNQRPQVVFIPGNHDTIKLEFVRQAECPDGTKVECPCDTNLILDFPDEVIIVPVNNSQWRQQERTKRRNFIERTKQAKSEDKTERKKSKNWRLLQRYKDKTNQKIAQITAKLAKKSKSCNGFSFRAVVWVALIFTIIGMNLMFQLGKRFSIFRKLMK